MREHRAARAAALLALLALLVGALADERSSLAQVFSYVETDLPVTVLRTSLDPSFLMAIDPNDPFFQAQGLLKTKLHAPSATALVRSVARKACAIADPKNKPLIIDIGANIGYFSALGASLGCQVYSFEPQFDVQPYFELMRALNGWESRIEHQRLAVSNASGKKFALPRLNDKGLAYLMDISQLDWRTSIEVTSTTLDEAFANDTREIVLLKVDVEGHELEALQGAERLIASRRVANLLIEFKRDEKPTQDAKAKTTLRSS
eukprot:tig00000227_g19826.t1